MQGGNLLTEFKPIEKTRYDANLEKYYIDYAQQREYHDFTNSRQILEEFFTIFEQTFVPKANGKENLLKCSFTIVNFQPSPVANSASVEHSRI